MRPVSVSQLTQYIKRTLSADPIISNIGVKGEVSNLKYHTNGAVYFSLKDEAAKLNCYVSPDRKARLRYELTEGMQITAEGSVSLYEKSGYLSLNVRDIEIEGEGELQAAFERLRAKLESEGLFAQELKRRIPEFPRKIGVVTSPTGAAVRDIISTVRRRNPLTDVVLYPCIVQGKDGAASICEGIRALNEYFDDIEVLIVGRGGGSKEDLWCFNEETVARAVRASGIPVISAVGHEVDFTICDFAADLRAATPTAAAELAVPHISTFTDAMQADSPERLRMLLENRILSYESSCSALSSGCRSYLTSQIRSKELALTSLIHGVRTSQTELVLRSSAKLELLKTELESVNPLAVLKRGYAIVKADGGWITGAKMLEKEDEAQIIFQDGSVRVSVQHPGGE